MHKAARINILRSLRLSNIRYIFFSFPLIVVQLTAFLQGGLAPFQEADLRTIVVMVLFGFLGVAFIFNALWPLLLPRTCPRARNMRNTVPELAHLSARDFFDFMQNELEHGRVISRHCAVGSEYLYISGLILRVRDVADIRQRLGSSSSRHYFEIVTHSGVTHRAPVGTRTANELLKVLNMDNASRLKANASYQNTGAYGATPQQGSGTQYPDARDFSVEDIIKGGHTGNLISIGMFAVVGAVFGFVAIFFNDEIPLPVVFFMGFFSVLGIGVAIGFTINYIKTRHDPFGTNAFKTLCSDFGLTGMYDPRQAVYRIEQTMQKGKRIAKDSIVTPEWLFLRQRMVRFDNIAGIDVGSVSDDDSTTYYAHIHLRNGQIIMQSPTRQTVDSLMQFMRLYHPEIELQMVSGRTLLQQYRAARDGRHRRHDK